MSIILRRCLAKLNLVLIKRDCYDAQAAENAQGITIWAGYRTAIDRYDVGLNICSSLK